MTENALQLVVGAKLLIVVLFAMLYAYGGMKGKWKRRYIAPSILVLAFLLFSKFAWLSLISLPLLIASLSLGYGGDTLGQKLFKRSYVGLAHCIALLPLYFVVGAWLVYGVHCFLILSFMISFGVWNPMPARYEETLIGLSIGLLPLFII